MSIMKKQVEVKNPRYTSFRAGELVVDQAVQRPLSSSHVNKIVGEFDQRKIGTLLVSKRASGELVVLDGQHRLQALRELGYGDQWVKCEVYEGLSLADEADLFRGRNTVKVPTAFDRFEKGVLAGHPNCVAIHDSLQRHGLRVVRGGTYEGRGVRAVGALERIYAQRDGLLDLTCAVVTEAWPMDPDAIDGHILEGVSLVLDKYWDEIDTDALIKKLAKHPGGPTILLANAKGQAKLGLSGSTRKVVSESIVASYNKGRSAKTKLGSV